MISSSLSIHGGELCPSDFPVIIQPYELLKNLRHHLLPQALCVVNDLKIAAGGEGPPHRPAEQRARGVAHQEIIPQDLQHKETVWLGFLPRKREESNWTESCCVDSIFYSADFFLFP